MNEEKKPFLMQVIWIIVLVVGVSMVMQLIYSSYSLWKKHDIVAEREAYLHTLETQQDSLKKELSDSLKPQYIEEEARNKLGLVKAGETAVIMPQSSGSAQQQPPVASEGHDNEPVWKLWVRLFF